MPLTARARKSRPAFHLLRGVIAGPMVNASARCALRGEELLKSSTVEPHDRLTVNDGHGRGGVSHLHQFIQVPPVGGADIFLRKWNPPLVKELLHFAAEQSARLRVNCDRFGHWHPSCSHDTPFLC